MAANWLHHFSHHDGSTTQMISTWQLKRQEENYLGQLEQMLVKRIRVNDEDSPLRAEVVPNQDLSDLSREINEELERIEALVREYDNE
ncbi:MAG: hypothetical protein MUF23_18320 [Pirellula sp.]|jgi:hypothetical protein|nr:hypothetical protein [Pirellula sp.]